jgi:NTE family protein
LLNWNTLDTPALPTRGVLINGSVMARYRQADARTVPLAQGAFEDHLPIASGTLTASLRGGSSFGEQLDYFDLFPLGGANDLRGFRFEQFHATGYATGELAYRRPFTSWKLFGERPQIGVWYDAAGVHQPLLNWQSAQSGSAGVMLNSPLGVIIFAVARTSDGQTRGWISVGRP